MSFLYKWVLSDDRGTMLVEYCFSSVDDCIKVVEMNLNGKFHRITWMSPEGRSELMTLLENHYHSITGVTLSSIQMRDAMIFSNSN